MASSTIVGHERPYRGCLVKISRLLTKKNTAELVLRYKLKAALFTEPAAVIKALEENGIISESNPEAVTDVLQQLGNEKALTEWYTSMGIPQPGDFSGWLLYYAHYYCSSLYKNHAECDNRSASCYFQLLYFSIDSSSNSEHDDNFTSQSSLDVQGHMKNALETALKSKDTNTKVKTILHLFFQYYYH